MQKAHKTNFCLCRFCIGTQKFKQKPVLSPFDCGLACWYFHVQRATRLNHLYFSANRREKAKPWCLGMLRHLSSATLIPLHGADSLGAAGRVQRVRPRLQLALVYIKLGWTWR